MKYKLIFCLTILILNFYQVFPQGTGINISGAPADNSAILDISSTDKGLLIPRMTTAQRDAINGGSIAAGSVIFNTTTNCFNLYDGSHWIELCSLPTAWSCGMPITDPRDGKIYNTVQIGTQCWLQENLNYGTYTPVHGGAQLAGEKYCTDISGNANDPSCTYGGLYEWAIIMNGASSSNAEPSGVQGICMPGWHLPSHNEWTTLERAVCTNSCAFQFPYDITTFGWRGTDESNKLKINSSLWLVNTGTNTSGFSAYPTGLSSSGAFYNGKTGAYFWSCTSYDANNAWHRLIDSSNGGIQRTIVNKTTGYPVRCVKD
ncbi:MAG: hypothetical protein HY958_14185 [Bacteroidia bacterium]|nr:hypothetical protein [Bacteroidia bacterium]